MRISILLLLLLSILALCSCRRQDKFPIEPIIKFVDFTSYNDKQAILTIHFTDGDGDIGWNETDSIKSNLFLTYFEYINNEWVAVPHPTPYTYRIPDLLPKGQKQPLEGEIEILINSYYGYGADTIKYDIYITDLSKHQSNTISTPTIIIPQ